jgi:hypothetical protein
MIASTARFVAKTPVYRVTQKGSVGVGDVLALEKCCSHISQPTNTSEKSHNNPPFSLDYDRPQLSRDFEVFANNGSNTNERDSFVRV